MNGEHRYSRIIPVDPEHRRSRGTDNTGLLRSTILHHTQCPLEIESVEEL